jgi:DNA-binding MarR family transcriptional regulator
VTNPYKNPLLYTWADLREKYSSKSKEQGAYRNDDPDTSVKAAESVDATKLERIVFDYICVTGLTGMTSEEIATASGMELASITPRLSPLEQKGWINRTEDRRPGKSGRGRIVWVRNPQRVQALLNKLI